MKIIPSQDIEYPQIALIPTIAEAGDLEKMTNFAGIFKFPNFSAGKTKQ